MKEVVKKFVDSIIAGNRELSHLLGLYLVDNGFREKAVKTSGERLNLVYENEASDYVFVFMSKSGYVNFPLIMDKADYEALNGKAIFLKLSNNDKTYRPAIRIVKDYYATNVRLHRYIYGELEKNMLVDHIAMSGSICTREMLRIVTNQQNCLNRKYRTKIHDNYFTTLVNIEDDDIITSLKSEGYRLKCCGVNKYRVTSPKFEDKIKMYEAINSIENECLGEYRYNPINACRDNKEVYLYLFAKCLNLSKDEYKEMKLYYLQSIGDKDYLNYYGLVV